MDQLAGEFGVVLAVTAGEGGDGERAERGGGGEESGRMVARAAAAAVLVEVRARGAARRSVRERLRAIIVGAVGW